MNKPVIGLMLGIGIFLYFAIVASMVSVKLNPDNVANQHQQQQAYGQLERQELTPEQITQQKEDLVYDNTDTPTEKVSKILQFQTDVVKITLCEIGREGNTIDKNGIAECRALMWEWKERCDNHHDVTGILPCKTYPDGYNLIKSFLEHTKP